MDIIIDCSDNDVKRNLLRLLKKKMVSLQITSNCHEYLYGKYQWRSKLINYSGILFAGANFVMSALGAVDGGVNVPLAVATAIALVIKGGQQYCAFEEKAQSHKDDYIAALDLSETIDYIILKNNHTRKSLQHELDIAEEKIKGFRKNEEIIPLSVKHMFMPQTK